MERFRGGYAGIAGCSYCLDEQHSVSPSLYDYSFCFSTPCMRSFFALSLVHSMNRTRFCDTMTKKFFQHRVTRNSIETDNNGF